MSFLFFSSTETAGSSAMSAAIKICAGLSNWNGALAVGWAVAAVTVAVANPRFRKNPRRPPIWLKSYFVSMPEVTRAFLRRIEPRNSFFPVH